MNQRIKRKLFDILKPTAQAGSVGKFFNIFIVTLICLNVAAVILETVETFSDRYSSLFGLFEVFSVGVFTIEYLLRLWSCTADRRFRHPVSGRVRYGLTFLAIVDLVAIVPFYLPAVVAVDLRFIRALRLFRFVRILKLGRYSDSLRTFGNVLRAKMGELLTTIFIVIVLLLLSSSLMYFVEHEAQPDAFSSIPATMWWGIATLTTVGYGDVYPITAMGRFMGAVIALLGVGMVALPAGVLASGFAEEIQKKRDRKCPHCGREI